MGKAAYFNGKIVPITEAKVSVLDVGFMYGYGLYETMRVYAGVPFMLTEHLSRLSAAADLIGLDTLPPPDELAVAVTKTIEANGYLEAVARLAVSPGKSAGRLTVAKHEWPTVVVTIDEFPGYREAGYRDGIACVTYQGGRGDLAVVKSLNFMPSVLARRFAAAHEAEEALFVSPDGRLTEAAACNVFLVAGDTLLTPGADQGILPGVTRQKVIELANTSGMDVVLRSIPVAELFNADEAFLTGSVIEVIPIRSIDGQIIGDGLPGKTTKRLLQIYREMTTKLNQP